jgi:hypothetical protein
MKPLPPSPLLQLPPRRSPPKSRDREFITHKTSLDTADTTTIPTHRVTAFELYYEATGEAGSAAEIRSTLDLLEARAQFDGPERTVRVRTVEQAGHIYLDLADEHWRRAQ